MENKIMRDVMIKHRVSIGEIASLVPSGIKFTRAEFAEMTGIAYPSTSERLKTLTEAGYTQKTGRLRETRWILHEYSKARMIKEGQANITKRGLKREKYNMGELFVEAKQMMCYELFNQSVI
jgi:DNA-binding transcriptional ArsR family regulator